MKMARRESDDLGVTIEAKFEVGEYQILILSAKESGGLEKWLKLNKYNIPKGAATALAPYIRDQMKFFVAKVDIKKVRRDANGLVVLSPLRFGFDSAELRLPVRLPGAAAGAQEILAGMQHDKKRSADTLRFILLRRPGDAVIDGSIGESEVISVIAQLDPQPHRPQP